MVVLLRTFGRSRDIVALFAQLRREAALGDYGHFLRNTAFVVLDASNGISKRDYSTVTAGGMFNVFVYAGANLGGGGNMAQVMLHARKGLEAASVTPDEVLLLDDDLGISLESLRRNWAASLFRSDSTMFTTPVFRQNNRRVLWEDGSMWGRFAGGSITGKREVIRPRFLRHGREITGIEGIGDLAAAHYPEYSTFIFQSLPYAALTDIGYPAAFFLRGDDIEYSLRGRARGHGVMSNPNLASWHEPAHSYGQEYMSSSHGLIVNLCYGQENADTLVQFFLQRALSHLGVADPLGLELYASILADINDREMFLTHGFAPRYVKRLGEFRRFDQRFEQLPPEIIQEILDQSDASHGQAEHHFFMYMTPEYPIDRSAGAKAAHASKDFRRDTASRQPLTQVILTNPNNWTQYIYRPQDGAHGRTVARAATRLYAEIDRFAENFEALKAHYNERLAICMEEPFWQEELAAVTGDPAVLISGHRNG
ncbi:glycosyltransferase family 2 protein, partial [Pseudorhodobacter sp.]|uniref:glycosyltransferase family 2 protein n=1 Tax=Pseudorhodobacter sp. TaxID=1934400 RepID=UPI002649B828